jgi:hypothetical protein
MVPVALQRVDEEVVQRDPEPAEVRRVLELEAQTGAGAVLAVVRRDQDDRVVEGQQAVVGVQGVVRADQRRALPGADQRQLLERQVLAEPAGTGAIGDDPGRPVTAQRGHRLDVGRARQLVLVAAQEVAVGGRHQVRLDQVHPGLQGDQVRPGGVLHRVARGAAMADDARFGGRRLRAGSCREGQCGRTHASHRGRAGCRGRHPEVSAG